MRSLWSNNRRAVIVGALCALIAACGGAAAKDLQSRIDDDANAYREKIPKPKFPSADMKNFEFAQGVYEDPASILWCTAFPANPSAPMITVPIAGKLTSSSVSPLPGSRARQFEQSGEYTPERRSLDGMYHGSPPPYRYGRTPGGQYVEFANVTTFCTTALTKFQRQKTAVSISNDAAAGAADRSAQDALRKGDRAGAQRILEQQIGDSK